MRVNNKKMSAGFTLIELMVVVVLIGIISLAILQVPDPGLLEVREARRELAIEISGGILKQINVQYGAAQNPDDMPDSGFWVFEGGTLVDAGSRMRHPFKWIKNDGAIHYAVHVDDVNQAGRAGRTLFWDLYDTDRSEKPFASLNLVLGKVEVVK